MSAADTPKQTNITLALSFSLIAAFLWGVLPVALKEILPSMDAATLVWYRFLFAAIPLYLFLARKKSLPKLIGKGRTTTLLFLVAAISLCSNYTLFSHSLNFVNAETSEAVIQLTTLFLILGGVFIYGEPFSTRQKLGTIFIALGLLLFFNDRLHVFVGTDPQQGTGVFLVVLAAITWTVYALIQKKLLQKFSSAQLLLLIYVVSIIGLLPLISPGQLFELSSMQFWLLGFCCMNTLVAYGAFAEAMVHWEASKVSAVLALAPLFTILAMEVVVYFLPDYANSDHLNLLAVSGAIVLVLGSIMTALAPKVQK